MFLLEMIAVYQVVVHILDIDEIELNDLIINAIAFDHQHRVAGRNETHEIPIPGLGRIFISGYAADLERRAISVYSVISYAYRRTASAMKPVFGSSENCISGSAFLIVIR